MRLRFLGAAGTVTGSRFAVEWGGGRGTRKALVDCGLFQGLKELRLRNWAAFPEKPSGFGAVILTHAHLDHSGYLPVFVKEGFTGAIYCSRPTRDLLRVLLLDAARLQEEDAAFANRHGYSKHAPALPLFDQREAEHALRQVKVVDPGKWGALDGGAMFRLTPSSHILGSCFVEIESDSKRVLFSGDMGRDTPLLLPPRESVEGADILVIESTYGDRDHPAEQPSEALGRTVRETHAAGGRLIIPCFAVGRTQEVVHLLAGLQAASQIPVQPVYLDSPMGIAASEIFARHPTWHRLSLSEIGAMDDLVRTLESRDESRAAMQVGGPAIVIAGSGMLTGGRVLHHLADRLGDPASTILLTGHQALGTRGWRLLQREPRLRLHGRWFDVRARVRELPGLSAHADRAELLAWTRGFKRAPKQTFVVHGELGASEALAKEIGTRLGWQARVPTHLEEAEI